MKIYKKTHTDEKALNAHVKLIHDRGGLALVKNNENPSGWTVTYWFDKDMRIDKKVSASSFNSKISKQIKFIKTDYDGDILQMNSYIAYQLMYDIAFALGSNPNEIDWENRSKKSLTHHQLVMDLGDVVISAIFIYVDENHKLVPDKSNIKILRESDYETIGHIILK